MVIGGGEKVKRANLRIFSACVKSMENMQEQCVSSDYELFNLIMRIFPVITLQLQSGQCGTEGSPRVANLWLHIQSGSPGQYVDGDGHH